MKKKDIIIFIMVFVLFIVLLVLFIVNVKKDINKINNNRDISNNAIKAASRVNENNGNSDISYENKNGINNSNSIKEEENQDNDDVVSYFENGYDDIVKNGSNIREKAKKYFIDIIDFIFYDKEINGYTFGEINDITKIKIIAIALKIDSKIDEYFPDYKETISKNGNKAYSNVKEKLVTSYLDLSVNICSNNESECIKVKEIFSDVKDNCKIGWDFIKKLAANGGNKVKEWYEIYSGKR